MGNHAKSLLDRARRLLRGGGAASAKKAKLMAPAEAWRWREQLRGLMRDQYGLDLHALQTDESAAPPRAVVASVQGSSKGDPTTFLGSGYREAFRYLSHLRDFGVDVSRMGRMLDLGVGTGRILLHFLPFDLERHGCDVTPEAVAWTAAALGAHATLRTTQLTPPLPYPDSFFDLIVATSVFTHTPYAAQAGWIAELRRVLAPGGCVAATVHDFAKLPRRARRLGWHEREPARGIHINTYLSEARLSELWGAAFDLVDARPYPPGQAHLLVQKAGARLVAPRASAASPAHAPRPAREKDAEA